MSKETREYYWTEGYGQFARHSVVTVECVEQRGKFYASMSTLNASPIGVGNTPDEAFAAWEARCRNAKQKAPLTPNMLRQHTLEGTTQWRF